MQNMSKPTSRQLSWLALAGVLSAGTMLGGVSPARAACDANTAGVSVCSGTDAAVSKTATGNLDVQFNNETVTTGGVTITGGAFNTDLNVVSATGPNPIQNTGAGDAVNINSTGGNVAVTTTAGAAVTAAAGNGIHATVIGGAGNTAITFNADITSGAGSAGILAASSSTGSTTIGGAGNVTGGTGGAINISNTSAATSGDLTINTSGNFNGSILAGVTQATNNANISVTHSGTVTSTNADAISATTPGGGNISITTSRLIQATTAVHAINASTATGGITINTGAVTVNSTGTAINATVTTGGTRGIAITTNGTITSTGGTGIASFVAGGSGNTAITFNGDVSFGSFGISATSNSSGSITVSGAGNVTGGTGAAVLVGTSAASSGDLTVNTSGNFGSFISAFNTNATNNANVSVTHTGTLTSTNADGISATTLGGGNVSVTTTKLIVANTANHGINAITATGGITINTGAVTVNSTGTAIQATVTTGATRGVAITTNGTITSTGGSGIGSFVAGGSGNTAITFNGDVSFASTATGIGAFSNSTGSITVSGSGNVTGGTGAAVAVGTSAATTSGDLTVNTSGNFGSNIAAFNTQAANNTNISVTHTGTVTSTNVDAISATTPGGGNVSITTSQLILANVASHAINAITGTGGITIKTGAVTVDSTGTAINAAVTAGGTRGIAITTNGTITSTGGLGILATVAGGSGGILINSNGAVDAPLFDAIVAQISGGGTGNITVNVNGAVTANAANVGLTLAGGTTTTVTNNSTITAGTGILADHVNLTNTATGTISGTVGVRTTAGPSSVFNAGTISGSGGTAIQFAGSGNTLTIAPTSVITGNALGTGADLFQLGGAGTGSFDAGLIGPAAQYRGFGAFAKVGSSTWTLAGSNALALPWTVQQGTLIVTGALANSAFTVNGGLLEGNGTIGTTAINSGGAFAPGAPGVPGTAMTIAGNLAFQSGALYLVQLSPSTASLANATGSAALAGNVFVAFAPGSYTLKQYDILHAAGGLGGTSFAGVSSSLPGFATSLSYSNTDVFLNLRAGLGGGGGLNVNQQNVANSINNFFNGGGALPSGFAALFGLTGGNLGNALTQLSGETATGSQQSTFDAMTMFMGVLTDPFIAGRGETGTTGFTATPFADEDNGASGYVANGWKRSPPDAYAMFTKAPPGAALFDKRWSVWAAGFGGSQSTDGNAATGSNATTSRLGGVAVGADYRFSPNTVAGFALAGGGTSFDVGNGFGNGSSDLFQAGVFVRHMVGAAYISAAAAYGWQDITTNRNVTVAGLDQLQARFNANAYSGRIDGGYRFVIPVIGGLGLTPYAALQATAFDLPAYAEQALTGNQTFALSYAAKSVTDSRSELGLRADKSFALATAILTLRSRAAWAYDYNPDRSIAATFQALPGASFVVNGAMPAHNSALTTLSAEMKWINGWSAAATFEGEFSNVTASYAGKGVVRYAW
jgi:uncharacterized protein with beta-barrel porin domain